MSHLLSMYLMRAMKPRMRLELKKSRAFPNMHLARQTRPAAIPQTSHCPLLVTPVTLPQSQPIYCIN